MNLIINTVGGQLLTLTPEMLFRKSSVSNPTFFHSVLRYLTTIPQLPLNPIPSGSVQAIRFALSLM